MKKIFPIAGITVLLFFIELIFMNFFGPYVKPNLLILLIIFIDLHLGSRWGIFVAVLSGFLKDSFSVGIFGANIFSFVVCVYVTTLTRRYILYDIEFGFLRILMALLISILNVFIYYLVSAKLFTVNFSEMIIFIMLPEALTTTLVAAAVFKGLKKCVLKLSV